MMTVRLYDSDSHRKTFTACVQQCTQDGEGCFVVLDRTAFFPEGGGQAADTGLLCTGPLRAGKHGRPEVPDGAVHVLDAQITADGTIVHKTDGPLPAGAKVSGQIDWDRRFRRMQSHSGEHIVSGLVHSTFGYDNIGFHLGEDDTTCDYNGMLTPAQIRGVEQRANEAVFQNIPVLCEYPDPALLPSMDYRSKLDLTENVRIVTIPGVDVCACCAPHVDRTGEIGLIKIVRAEKSHGGTRLHLKCGFDALEDYDEKQDNILKIMDLLSARQFETAAAAEALQQQNAALTHELSEARTRQAEIALEALDGTPENPVQGNLVCVLRSAETDALRALATGGKLRCSGVFAALCPSGTGYRYMITSSTLPLRGFAKTFNEALDGRGGGKDEMLQGFFGAPLKTIRSFFATWRAGPGQSRF